MQEKLSNGNYNKQWKKIIKMNGIVIKTYFLHIWLLQNMDFEPLVFEGWKLEFSSFLRLEVA